MLLAGVGLEVRSVGRTNVNSTCYPIVDTFRWFSSELAARILCFTQTRGNDWGMLRALLVLLSQCPLQILV